MAQNPTLIGSVQDVSDATIGIALDSGTISGLSFIDGHGYRVGQIGSFVRIPIGYMDLFGVVSQIGAGAVPDRLLADQPYGFRWMTVQLIGEARRGAAFARGISQHPTVGDPVHIVTEKDLQRVYGRPDAPNVVRIGHIAGAESIPALIDVNKLVGRHCAVVGATGSGKSTTVASVVRALTDTTIYPSARALILDIHGEYARAFSDRASVFRVHPNIARGELPLCVPYWAMTSDELLSVTFGALEDNQRSGVLERIVQMKAAALLAHPVPGVTDYTLTVDTPVPFSVHELWLQLHRMLNSTHTAPGTGQSQSTEALVVDAAGNPIQPGDALRVVPPRYQPQVDKRIYLSQLGGANLNIRRQLDALASRLRDPRFDFLFKPGPWMPDSTGGCEADLDLLIEQWIGGPHPISVIDLSGVPQSIVNSLIGAVLRILYEALFWARHVSEGARERPLLLVLEEAHSYLSAGDHGPAGHAVRRIVKEGRKYGFGAMVVSQRPAEIDSTVLSQCGTTIAMRLANSSDREHVTGAVADNLDGLMAMLPALRVGEAIVIGEAVQLPMRTQIQPPPLHLRPDSTDPLVFDEHGPGGWARTRATSDYREVVQMWRTHNPLSPKVLFDNSSKKGPAIP